MDLTGITNQNEYYTNHYFSSIFEENASDTISKWRAEAKESEEVRTPWALLRDAARQYYPIHDRFLRSKFDTQTLANIRNLADIYLSALGYPKAEPEWVDIDDTTKVPVYLELNKPNGAPALWVLLATSDDKEAAILDKYCFSVQGIGEEGLNTVSAESLTAIPNEDLVTKMLFGQAEPPRFVILIGMNQIALIDRNKWNEKRYLQFELEEIFSRHEESTLQAMAVLLHRNSLCPEEGTALLDELDANSQKHAAGVSQDLKYALRESIELLGNEVLYDMATRQGRDLNADPVDAGQLTIECLRYMYRMLFLLFIEARPELGYAPIKAQSYLTGYSLESLRDIADDIRDEVTEVGSGYYLHETLSKLYDLIYNGYPATEEEVLKYSQEESLHDMFVIAPLKAHIFDPEYTKMITAAKLRNSVMLRIIDLMSLTRETGKRNDRRGRISYANLGINQMGSVYEALLSYRGFIAEHTLFEVKRAGDSFNELDVGYFVAEEELDQYTEDERVRYEKDDPDGKYKKGQLRKYEKGTFIYRLAGREREKSASYYTPEVLTKCLVKYALKELLEGKTADEILHLTICEPAMGSAAFLNEGINQIAEAYLDKKQKELGEMIPAEKRLQELQKVKMYIADRNVYGIDLNPVAVELAEVSLWLNTIYEGGFVPWFGTQLVNGNSLIGARRQCYQESALTATSKGLHWYENAPERVPLGTERKKRRGNAQIYHFLLGDPGMCSYSDKVIKSLEPDNIKKMKDWNKKFTAPYSMSDIETLRGLSEVIDELWENQIKLRQTVEEETQDKLSVYGYSDTVADSHTTIRQKDQIYSKLYKSEHMKNAGPYARLKFAMDYWCALWFWPIDKADMLPSRSEFLNDMNLILVGTFSTKGNDNMLMYRQLSLFPTEQDEILAKIDKLFPGQNVVDIDNLCTLFPRLALVREFAEQNHFMHWELEFADLFKERGGFDLVIGNPPWVKIEWKEQNILSDHQPLFALRNYSATQITKERAMTLESNEVRIAYFHEYAQTDGQKTYLNSIQNYPQLVGQKANLYKCFLPQAWAFTSLDGISAFVHPNGVFEDSNGGQLREVLYPRIRRNFRFINELRLFNDVHHETGYGLSVYGKPEHVNFDLISKLYDPSSIEICYETNPGTDKDRTIKINGWVVSGNRDRIIHISEKELKLFAKVFDDSDKWKEAHLPDIYCKQLIDVLERFVDQQRKLGDIQDEVFTTQFWNETIDKSNGVICEEKNGDYTISEFPETIGSVIYSAPNIGSLNPYGSTTRHLYRVNSDYDRVDLTAIPEDYLIRCKYRPGVSMDKYYQGIPESPWGKVTDFYRIVSREFVGCDSERTLTCAIAPRAIAHVNAVFSACIKNCIDMVCLAGCEASVPYDFFVKCIGKRHINYSTYMLFPLFEGEKHLDIVARTLLMNCLSVYYRDLWKDCWHDAFKLERWSKDDSRLSQSRFGALTSEWNWNMPLHTDYERRQALIELDVLVAMALGMTLEQLKTIYRIQFPILQQYEADTWYDANGRIVFANNRSLTNVGFSRPEWENNIKGAPAGQKFYRTITDDTMPGGPVERTIEYVAPFDRCDREQDYETAWKFFEEKYGGVK
ncbi:MAG: class I SAM-dependent DNA methyltransferase [Lachnospiraceae bacterium]|nr:class I SAM-dependent DNA methyltransferase [Lachnospiraceae bacterium]